MAAKNLDPLGDNDVGGLPGLDGLEQPDAISLEGGAQDWVQTCGVCHVGGGQLEYDRNGNPYSNDGFLADGITPTPISPDGDRFMFDYPKIGAINGELVDGFMNDVNKAEVDCLLCHLDWTAGASKNNNGLALLQTWGCNADATPDTADDIGPINDPTCATDALTTGPGVSYDMYNRNFAVKSRKLDLAASMGLGAIGKNSLGAAAPKVGDLASIDWGRSTSTYQCCSNCRHSEKR